MTKRKTKTALGVLPDRYTSRTDAIQPSLQTQIAQIQREASQKQNQLDYYLNGSNYIVKPDRFGNIKVYMGDNEEEVPTEFLPRLRASNRYIDMALTPAPEQPTVAPLSNQLVQEQKYSPTYQDGLRRQRQNVYEHNTTEESLRKPIREFTQGSLELANEGILKNPVMQVLGYAVSPSTYTNLLSSGIDTISGSNTSRIAKPLGYGLDALAMFFPVSAVGKLSADVKKIQTARELLNLNKTAIEATSFTKIDNALKALQKNPLNKNAIKTLQTQFKANPKYVETLKKSHLFDGMQEFQQALQPFKITGHYPSVVTSNKPLGARQQVMLNSEWHMKPTGNPTFTLSPSKASEYEAKILSGSQNKDMMDLIFYSDEGQRLLKQNPQLSNILAKHGYDLKLINISTPAEQTITTAGITVPTNQIKLENGKYLRSNGNGTFTELKEGDWFLDEHNQIRRLTTKDGKLTDLLDSELATQRRQQIAAETEAKIKEAEQKGREAAKKEFENSKPTTETASSESDAPITEPKKYAYLPLANGKTVTLEVNGNTAIDPVTGSTFELYPGTTRVKQMDYTVNPSFPAEHADGLWDIDTGNPAKWKPLSWRDKNPLKQFQRLYTKAGNAENPQRLVSNYGTWDFANKDKGRLMNNTREFSPKKAWGLGAGLGIGAAAWIQGKGLWGVTKTVGNGAAKAGEAVVFGNDNPFRTPQDSTKQKPKQQQEEVDTLPTNDQVSGIWAKPNSI